MSARPVDAAPCPECAAGKHQNCDGIAWDNATDRPVACPCTDKAHLHISERAAAAIADLFQADAERRGL